MTKPFGAVTRAEVYVGMVAVGSGLGVGSGVGLGMLVGVAVGGSVVGVGGTGVAV